MSKVRSMSRFGGSEFYVYLPEEDKVIMEIQAINWREENFVRGEFILCPDSIMKEPTGPQEIVLQYWDEAGLTYEIRMKKVMLIFQPGSDIIRFDAYELEESEQGDL